MDYFNRNKFVNFDFKYIANNELESLKRLKSMKNKKLINKK